MTIEQEFLNAARTGDQKTFLNILNDHSTNIDPNQADEHGETVLIIAAQNGHIDIVRALLADKRVDPDHPNQKSNTALMEAARGGHIDIVRFMLADKRIDPNCNDQGNEALIWAARCGFIDIVRFMLADKRIDPNQVDKYGRTALIVAAFYGHGDIVNMLLADKRVNPNRTNKNGYTALFQAASYGHSDIVSALIDDPRIDLSHADQAKKAIIAATKNKHDKTLLLLLKSSGQRLSVDDIANLTRSDQGLYRFMLYRTRLLCRARFQGIVRGIIIFRRMRLRAAEAVYAPGGTGYVVAADSFASAAASQQSSSTITLTSTETNDTTAGITRNSSEPAKPLNKK